MNDGPASMVAAAIFYGGGLLLLLVAGATFDRYVTRRLQRFVAEALRDNEWPDPGLEDDWRAEPSNVRVLPSQRVSR